MRQPRAALLLLVVTLTLWGCAAPTSLTSQVVSHGQWGAQRPPGTFVYERLPSQQADADLQARQATLEQAALPALVKAGFVPVADAPQAVYGVQLSAQTRVERQPWSRYDPYWDPLWGPFWGPYPGPYPGPLYGRPYPGPWGPRGVPPGALGPRGPGWMGPGAGPWPAPPPPRARMQIDVLVRERATGQVLYEAHARHDRLGTVDSHLWPALAAAALANFPATQAEPVDIEVPLSPEGR
jgi:hypothetical protein